MSSVLLTYSKLIMTNVASQAINLADSGIMGHRVQCPMSVDDMNRFFTWHRAAGESAPIGHFTPQEDISGASFSYILANTLSKYYTDIDGVTGGLNFSSAILDSNLDPAIRQNGKITANDIIMAYVIYKIYGSSANPTMNVVFNIQDAYDMLPNSVLINSIKSSLQAEEELASAGAVNDMFQDLLSEDPTRFFDAAGKQIPGLFETSTGESATGSWNFVENDRIELNVQFTFVNSVSVNSTAGDAQEIESKVVIPAGSTFKIRLQLLATNTPTAAAAIQKAYVAATTEELTRQVAAQKEAAQKAADAFAVATQAIEAAQKQAASAQATLAAAITRNAKQQKTVASAQAALAAAQAALAAAKTSGNQANIQQQNAAAIAAQALLENQQAIADLASAELQNAETAIAKATATVNAAQTAAANASAAQAAALAAAATASLALETASAAALASTISSATDASDPLTQALEAEKAAILDPQNLTTLLAKANAATNNRKAALDSAVTMFANQTAQLNNYNSVLYNMNSAIATGSNDSQLQLYKAMVIGASNIVASVSQTSKAAASTLAASYTAELTAIQRAALASSNAASLSATVAAANTNSANRSLTAAMNAYVYASTMNASAAVAAAEAQATLNNRVANGAVMTEVQTRTQALLDANKTYAAATSTMNGALAKMTNSTKAFQAASTIAVEAKVHISSVAASNLFTLTHYQTSVSTSSAYQANVLSNAKLNQIAIEVNSSLIRLNAANAALATAEANVSLAQLAINTALAGGAILSEITVLKDAYSKANNSLTQALLIQKTAQAEYESHTEHAANGQVQLLQSGAMAFYNASITQKQLATDNILHYSTLLDYAGQQPDAFPPVDGLPASTVYATQLSVWKTYLGNFETLSASLLTQFNTDLMRASTLMAANPSISTSLGSLSNYYVANSNSSHLVFQANSITSLLASLSNVGLAPSDLETDLAAYSSQTSAALTDTATAYNTFLAESLAAQSISLVSSVGQEILNTASKFQLAQISSATMNTKLNFYNSTLAAVNMLQLEYDQATSVMAVTEQALSNATMGVAPPAEITILQQKYASAAASQSRLANKLSGLSETVVSMNETLFQGSSAPTYQTPSVPGLQLWLDASDPLGTGSVPSNGTALATWKDKSSNNYNAVAGGNPLVQRNSLNSLPGIALVGDFYTAPIPPTTFANAMTMFVVYKNTAYSVYNALITRSFPGNNLGGPDMYNGGILTNNSSAQFGYNGYNIPSVYTTTPSLFELTIDQGADSVYHWITGTSQNVSFESYNSPLTPSTADANNDTLYIGTRGDNGTSFQGVFYEILVYNTALSTAEREEVEGYLAWKWGLQAQLPTTHSYFLSYPNISGTPSGPISPYSASSALRQAELAVAKKNELVQQANNAYNKYSQLNDRLQAVNESTNSVLDKISVAMAKGANLSTIQPLQTQLSATQEDAALMYLQSAKLYDTFLTLSTLITPDQSFISTVNSTSNATFTATISARLNESAQQLQTAQIEDTAAATALAQANATLILVSTQFSIKKQQGLSSQEIEPLRSTFTSASLDFANKNILLNFANTALAQAQSNYDSIYTNYSVGNPNIYSAFANTSNNLVTSLSTLVSAQNNQVSSLQAATSNVLAVELTNAYMSMLNYSTLTQTDFTHYQDLLVKYNTQMAAGNTENIASIYADMTIANNKYLENSQREILYTGAYLSSLSMATINPQSKDILNATALNQTKVIQGARANDLYKNLEDANSAVFTLNNNFVSAQSAYTIAQSDLQTATANDSSKEVLDIKFSTLVGVSNELAQIQIKYNLAQSALQLAKSYVSMNPNAQSILDTASAKYLAQANLAQANVLVSQYNAAVANEKEKYDALQTANAALASAQETFNSVVASGGDLASIKAARDAQNAAATAVTQAALLQNNAMKSLNQALQNANLDQIAQSLILTARLTNENTTAGGKLNGEQVTLDNFSTFLGKSLANLNVAKNAHTTATSILGYSANPSTEAYSPTFVNDLYNVSANVINNATVSGKTITFINPQVQIYGNDMNYKYLMFSPAQPDDNFYIRLQDPGDSQNTIPWIVFDTTNEFSIINPLGIATYYGPTPYTTSNKFLIRYNDSTSEFEYYMDNVLLYSFPYAVSNPIVWSLLNWLAFSSVTIDYAGMGPPGAGLTTQETANIQQAADAATARFVAAQLAYSSAMNAFNNQAILVSSLTQKFSTTTGLLKINTENNELLYNGFVYNQTYDKYVLLKSFLPIPVIAGAPFNLYSATVNPINMGVYNPATRYILGNLVYHPNSDGAQYMCAVSRDPRGP